MSNGYFSFDTMLTIPTFKMTRLTSKGNIF